LFASHLFVFSNQHLSLLFGHKKTCSAIAKAGHQIHHLVLAVFISRPQADLKSAR